MDRKIQEYNKRQAITKTLVMAGVASSILKFVENAANYEFQNRNGSEIINFTAYNYDFELDTTVGCFRKKMKGSSGPWTRWTWE